VIYCFLTFFSIRIRGVQSFCFVLPLSTFSASLLFSECSGDLREYLPRVKPGGYLVVDDCGNSLDVVTERDITMREGGQQQPSSSRSDDAFNSRPGSRSLSHPYLMPSYMGWPQVCDHWD
jgi:hypothetical protein